MLFLYMFMLCCWDLILKRKLIRLIICDSNLNVELADFILIMLHWTEWLTLCLLVRPQQQSIVMSTSVFVCVCVSVCLSMRISPEPHAQSLPNFCACCLSPWLGSPPAGWCNSTGKGQFWEFSSPLKMHCMAVWISLRRTDLAWIYFFIINSDRIQSPIIKLHYCN